MPALGMDWRRPAPGWGRTPCPALTWVMELLQGTCAQLHKHTHLLSHLQTHTHTRDAYDGSEWGGWDRLSDEGTGVPGGSGVTCSLLQDAQGT